jgi:DNA-binding IscR family transcriptional regulator
VKLSLHSEHVLLILIHLARINRPASVAEIASLQDISADSLSEILSVLIGSGYAVRNSAPDQVRLGKAAEEISVGEIIRLFDGALAPLEPVSAKGYAPAPMDREVKLIGLFEQIQEEIVKRLDATTIAELV